MFKKYYPWFLLAAFVLVWMWSGWHPGDAHNWLMENNLVFLFVPLVLLLLHYMRLSKLSLTLITLFFVLHIVGAHYNYGSVPFGTMVGQFIGTADNSYDKLVHFSFGLLIVYPLREFLLRAGKIRGVWGYCLPLSVILSWSALYEIAEWLSFINLDPHQGYLFIGGNDPFDTHKDMAAAGVGALITLLVVAVVHICKEKHFFGALRTSITFGKEKGEFPKEDRLG